MLKVDDLYFRIGETKILNGITMSINKGETVGIIGPNGSGKTTLFNCISGFNIPQSGSITFRDKNVTRIAPHFRAKLGMGRVFQNFGIFKEMTVRENILTALESGNSIWASFLPWSKGHRKNLAVVNEYLEEVGIEEKAADKAGSLSGGQMRLLEIIRTLAFGAELFLLDEPTAGVSPKMKDDVAALIRKLQKLEKTVLVIEHDINFIQKFCDRIVVLDVGQVVMDDTPDKVRNDKMLQDIYFGTQKANGEQAQS